MAELKKIPPVTRFLCFSSLGITIPVLMNLVHPFKVVFLRELITQKLEIWRLYTSFFLGGSGLNYVFELVMLYRNADQLESGPYSRRSADFAWQLILAGVAIIATCLPLGAYAFSRPLLVALTYLSSALAPSGSQTSIMGLVTLPVKYLPYIMIVMDLLMAGPAAAALAIAGAIVGHFWWWTMWSAERGRRPLLEPYSHAPAWMRWIVGDGTGPAGVRGGVQVIPPRNPAGGSTFGYNWGSGGRRLGT